jgi:plastocyanin
MKKHFLIGLGAALLISSSSLAIAQEAQKATIVMTDNKFEPSELTLKPGKVEFTLINKGALRHNLRLKLGDKDLKLNNQAKAGETVKTEVDLVAGQYDMSCGSTEGGGSHREKGMVGKLIVK